MDIAAVVADEGKRGFVEPIQIQKAGGGGIDLGFAPSKFFNGRTPDISAPCRLLNSLSLLSRTWNKTKTKEAGQKITIAGGCWKKWN
jgi:hypothetical protein